MSATKPCGTCFKPVYSKEKLVISEIWLHSHCLKCSCCGSTLALSSVYVSVGDGEQKKLYCKTDVPRAVHTAVVDSIALRHALSAPKADAVGKKALSGTAVGGGSMRFKGLTLRSKGMHGVNAPRLGVQSGMNRVVVGLAQGGRALDSWDIAHALEVQSHTSSPLASFPAIKAQHTGSLVGQWTTPSILVPQTTGSSSIAGASSTGEEDDGIARERKGVKEEAPVEKDLVKNLLRAFQLDTLQVVEVPSSETFPSPTSSTITSTGPQSFSSIKLSSGTTAGSTDLITFSTLGTSSRLTRKGTFGPTSLRAMFVPPSEHEDEDKSKHTVRFSSKAPSIIEFFAPASSALSIPLPDSPTLGAEEEGEMDVESLARRMEEEGIEVVMLYEEDPDAAMVSEGEEH